MKKTRSKPTKNAPNRHLKSTTDAPKLTFIEHLRELRQRLLVIIIVVLAGSTLAYQFRESITDFLLWPAGEQQFIFTSPAGGFEFLFKICTYTGIVLAIPVIIYEFLRYIQPLIGRGTEKLIIWGTIGSAVLAGAGIVFGYFFGLPPALQFLLQTFSSDQIEALLSIQSYVSFVTIYLLGAALIFQVPLVLLIINRLTPLKPSTLLRQQRWFIVTAFAAAAIISPTSDIPNMLILALPMLLMYYIGVLLVWIINKKQATPARLLELRDKDTKIQLARLEQFKRSQEALKTAHINIKQSALPAKSIVRAPAKPKSPIVHQTPVRKIQVQRTYIDNFTRQPAQAASPMRRTFNVRVNRPSAAA